jgi:hypothetical protein
MDTIERVKHYIRFLCPGTFVDEQSEINVPEEQLTIEHAMEVFNTVIQRYGSKPYAFYLVTETWTEAVADNGEVLQGESKYDSSAKHYINGTVLTVNDIPSDNRFDVLRSNMRYNNIPAVVRTQNSYTHHGALEPTDIVLQGTTVVARGADYYPKG